MLRVHQQTLRNWEKVGLIEPSRVGVNRARVYDDNHLKLLQRILHYSGKGISLRGIRELIQLGSEEV